MYGYKTKYTSKLRWIFGALRFITLFSILLLLLDLQFKGKIYTTHKPDLIVLIDDTKSVKEMGQVENVLTVVEGLTENKVLNENFNVTFFSFGEDLKSGDSLSFNRSNTNISKALFDLNNLYKNDATPIILISDGNQTLGTDYEFTTSSFKHPVYPFVIGDTAKYVDLKIDHLNTNRYSFLKNEFPVEIFLSYNGTKNVNTELVVSHGSTDVYSEKIAFSNLENYKTIEFNLPAENVGLQKYMVNLKTLEGEKNISNNIRNFAVEIIDQSTNVLLVSDIIHPDLGVLKKSIESNEQRKVSFMTPLEATEVLRDFQLVILYQPNRSFASLFQVLRNSNNNTLIVTGLQTDWNLLNSVQNLFSKDAINESEEISGVLNPNYSAFAIKPMEFEKFRPLKTSFGEIIFSVPYEIILEQSVQNISTGTPILATMELDGKRNAIWDGEGFWKWRSEVYLKSNDFKEFDEFISNVVQYLASSKRRSRLEVNNETFYYSNNSIRITAQYFDNNFVFDSRGSLIISVTNTSSKKITEYPMLLKNNFYEVDLSSLASGEYEYVVYEQNENISRGGSFSIIEFNVEQQFLHSNVTKLQRVATNTNGSLYFDNQSEDMINDLINDDRYRQIQKSEEKVVPLIDWKFILLIIVIALTLEWFIRKYNGLI